MNFLTELVENEQNKFLIYYVIIMDNNFKINN